MFGLKKDKAFVGLDIGSYAVKAIELEIRTKGRNVDYEVAQIGYERLPHDAIVEGSIIDAGGGRRDDPDVLFDKAKIGGQGRRHLHLRQLGHHQEDRPAGHGDRGAGRIDHLGSQAQHPLSLRGDARRLRHPPAARRGRGPQPRDPARGGQEGQDRGLRQRRPTRPARTWRPSRSTRSPCTTPSRSTIPRNSPEKTVALVNIGANITTLVIAEKGVPQLFRDLSIGGAYFLDNIRKDLNVGPDDADSLLRGEPPRRDPGVPRSKRSWP